jgi:hypothetical protein
VNGELTDPGCEAVMVQVPLAPETATMFRPETVHTEGVLEVKTTVKPDEAVALDAKVEKFGALLDGCAKVMVWAVRLATRLTVDVVE